jgi:hypothetical protein
MESAEMTTPPTPTAAPANEKIIHGVNCDCRHKLACEDAEEAQPVDRGALIDGMAAFIRAFYGDDAEITVGWDLLAEYDALRASPAPVAVERTLIADEAWIRGLITHALCVGSFHAAEELIRDYIATHPALAIAAEADTPSDEPTYHPGLDTSPMRWRNGQWVDVSKIRQRAESGNGVMETELRAAWAVYMAESQESFDIDLMRECLEAAAQARAGESADRTCWHCGAGAMPEHFKYCYMCGSDIDRAANPSAPTQTGAAGEAALGAMKERAQRAHALCNQLRIKNPNIPELSDDGELHDAIHDILRVDTPSAIIGGAVVRVTKTKLNDEVTCYSYSPQHWTSALPYGETNLYAAPAPPVSAEVTGQMLMAAMNAHFASCDAEMCACYTRPHHMRPALEAALAARQQPTV